MGIVNDVYYEWTFLVDGKKVSVETKQNNETLGKIELAKALSVIENDNNALKKYYDLKKQYHIERKGPATIKKSRRIID